MAGGCVTASLEIYHHRVLIDPGRHVAILLHPDRGWAVAIAPYRSLAHLVRLLHLQQPLDVIVAHNRRYCLL